MSQYLASSSLLFLLPFVVGNLRGGGKEKHNPETLLFPGLSSSALTTSTHVGSTEKLPAGLGLGLSDVSSPFSLSLASIEVQQQHTASLLTHRQPGGRVGFSRLSQQKQDVASEHSPSDCHTFPT